MNATPTLSFYCMHCHCHHIVAYCRVDASVLVVPYSLNVAALYQRRKKKRETQKKILSPPSSLSYECKSVYILSPFILCALGSLFLCRCFSVMVTQFSATCMYYFYKTCRPIMIVARVIHRISIPPFDGIYASYTMP